MRLRQLGHADTVAPSSPSVSASRSRASAASNTTSSPSASRITSSGAATPGTVAPPPAAAPGDRTTVGGMRALVIADQQVRVEERPDPEPGPGEVVVRVHGAGLNRADLVQRAGFYHAPPGSPADIPGLEFAGEVVAHGDGVSEPALGARVFGIAGGGGQAELIAVPASQCAPVPDALDLVS